VWVPTHAGRGTKDAIDRTSLERAVERCVALELGFPIELLDARALGAPPECLGGEVLGAVPQAVRDVLALQADLGPLWRRCRG
jgi:hypothetical protein